MNSNPLCVLGHQHNLPGLPGNERDIQKSCIHEHLPGEPVVHVVGEVVSIATSQKRGSDLLGAWGFSVVCMFFPCLRVFSPGALISSRSPETCVWELTELLTLALSVHVNGCLSTYVELTSMYWLWKMSLLVYFFQPSSPQLLNLVYKFKESIVYWVFPGPAYRFWVFDKLILER